MTYLFSGNSTPRFHTFSDEQFEFVKRHAETISDKHFALIRESLRERCVIKTGELTMKVMIENKGPLPVAVGEQTILPGERTTLEGYSVLMLEEVDPAPEIDKKADAPKKAKHSA
jgi:hypothetical protein